MGSPPRAGVGDRRLDVDVVTMESVIDRLGRHRFLAFDRDHGTGAPTVEVAHEALLNEWARLRGWIEEGRDDLRRHAALTVGLGGVGASRA